MKKAYWMVLVAVFAAGSAYAESLEGTITGIDRPGKCIIVHRSNPDDQITVQVNDDKALNRVQVGSPVRVQADHNGTVWSATSIQVPQENLVQIDETAPKSGASANESVFKGTSRVAALRSSDVNAGTTVESRFVSSAPASR